MGALDEILTRLTGLPPEKQDELAQLAKEATASMRWVPNPGPQTDAFFSEADEMLFGGEAGGGKSDLLVGLSLTAHQRSLVLRRTNSEAVKLLDRYREIIGDRTGLNEQKGVWRIDGRVIDIGGCQLEDDKQKRKGIAHDLKAFDELVDFTESQYTFIIGWNRTTKPGQRTRIVATTNPPTKPEGMWVVKRWAAWLDPTHPNPAKPGELRWYTTIDGEEKEVDGPGPYLVNGRKVLAKSRTFIRSRLEDNPNLSATDYASRLAAMPKELREAYAEGRFDSNLKDQPFQAIPTEWVRLAQERWKEKSPHGTPMCAIGVDASGGGEDPMIIAPRYDGWYPELIEVPGAEIPAARAGKYCAGLVVSFRRDHAIVVVDMGGGYGGPLYEQLRENGIEAQAYKGSEASVKRTKDGVLKFANTRTAAIWRFREALDPSEPGGSPIMLPPGDSKLIADLCAPTFWVERGILHVESKESVCKRLGRSTDRGDAVVMAWAAGPTYLTDGDSWASAAERGGRMIRQTKAVMGRR
jgi:hypothetical protein